MIMPPRRRRSRGHIRELPSGSFQAIVYAGVEPLTAKERYLRETQPSYDEARLALTREWMRLNPCVVRMGLSWSRLVAVAGLPPRPCAGRRMGSGGLAVRAAPRPVAVSSRTDGE